MQNLEDVLNNDELFNQFVMPIIDELGIDFEYTNDQLQDIISKLHEDEFMFVLNLGINLGILESDIAIEQLYRQNKKLKKKIVKLAKII